MFAQRINTELITKNTEIIFYLKLSLTDCTIIYLYIKLILTIIFWKLGSLIYKHHKLTFICITFLGNIIVIITIGMDKELRKNSAYMFMFNLAMSDFIISFFDHVFTNIGKK